MIHIFDPFPHGWERSIAPTQICFQHLDLLVPMQATENHSCICLIHRDTLEPQPVLVEEVDTGVSGRARLWSIRARGPFVSGEVFEGWIQVREVCAAWWSTEILTLVYIGATAV